MPTKKIKELKKKYNQYVSESSWKKALVVISKMIEVNPTSKYYTKQGGIFYKLEQFDKSLESITRALEIDRDNSFAKEFLKKLQKKNVNGEDASSMVETLLDVSKSRQVSDSHSDEKRDEQKTNPQFETVVAQYEENNTKIFYTPPLTPTGSITSRSTSETTPNQFGRYSIIDKVGSGGMGHVYKVKDTQLDRILALKIVNIELETTEGRERFIREAQATAKLNHPNIISVHDIGEQDGRNFFTMDYIEGKSLKAFLQDKQLQIKDILKIFLQVCNGIEYAHQHGIIHRDIKPSNIMVNKNSVPQIMDFGLAKVSYADNQLSRTGQQMGTPAYMSPEQADGNEIDTRADIYSLGATLYETLTGRPPFQGENHFNIIYQLHYKDPISISLLNPDVPGELEAICLKCLEKSPKNRYASTQQLCDDIDHFLHDRPILAKPATSLSKSWKWIKRNRGFSISVAIIMLSLISGGSFSFFQWHKAVQAEEKAVTKSINILIARANENILRNEWREAGTLAGEALQLILPYEKMLPSDFKTQAYQIVRSALYGMGLKWETYISTEKDNLTMCNQKMFLGKEVYRLSSDLVEFGHNGKIIAAACKDGSIKIYDNYDGSHLYTLKGDMTTIISSLAFFPDGNILVSGDGNGAIKLWDLRTRKQIESIQLHGDCISALDFTPDGKYLVSGSWDKTVKIMNMDTRQTTLLEHEQGVSSIDLGNHAQELAVVSGTDITIWNLTTRMKKFEYDTIYAPNTGIAYNNDGSLFAVSSWENKIQIYEPNSKKMLTELVGHTSGITSLQFQQKENVLVSSSEDGEIIVWDVDSYYPIRSFSSDVSLVQSVVFHPGNRHLVSLSENSMLRFWSISSKDLLKSEKAHENIITEIVFSKNGDKMVSACKNGEILLWDFASMKVESRIGNHGAKVLGADFNKDNSILVTCGYDNSIRFWDLKNKKQMDIWKGHEDTIAVVRFSPDYKHLISASIDCTIRIWDVKSKKCIKTISGDKPFFCASYSPDGKKIAIVAQDISILDATTYQVLHKLQGHKSWFSRIAFSPDGSMLASSSGDNTVRLWNVKEGKQIYHFRHDTWVWKLEFHPNKNFLACACADGNIRIINTENGTQTYLLSLQKKQNIFALAFHPEGNILVTGSADCQIKFWNFNDEWSHSIIPGWFDSMEQYTPLSMDLNFRCDASGAVIDKMLSTQPRKICQKLFSLKVEEENFSISPYVVDKNKEYQHICSFSAFTKYLEDAQRCYEHGNERQALDCLQMSLKFNAPKSADFIDKFLPNLKEKLANIYVQQAERLGNYQKAIEMYDVAISLNSNQAFHKKRELLHSLVANEDKIQKNIK